MRVHVTHSLLRSIFSYFQHVTMGVIKSLLSNENFHLLMSVCRMVCYKHPYSFHPQTITTTLSSQPSFNTIYIF